MSEWGRPKDKITALLSRVSPPPYTSVHLSIGYADAGLDRSIPLFDRWRLVTTAVRLALLERKGRDASVDELRILRDAGVCQEIEKVAGMEVCGANRNELRRNLITLVLSVNEGRIPVTEGLVETLSQAVILVMASFMDQKAYSLLEKYLEETLGKFVS